MALGALPIGIPAVAVVVAFSLSESIGPVEAVVVGVAGIVLGRTLLYLAAARGRGLIHGGATAANLEYVHGIVERRWGRLLLGLAVAIPGSPTTALFAAGGLVRAPLTSLVVGYTLNRTVVYTAAVAGATAGEHQIESALGDALSPWTIGLGILVMAASMALLLRIDWRRTIADRRPRLVRRDP